MTSVPKIISIGDVYQLTWSAEHVFIQIDHIAEGESISGEFEVKVNGAGPLEHVYQSRVNMLSVSGKKSFADVLKKRVDLEWETIVEQACFKTIEAYRKGDPVESIGDMPPRNTLRYRLYPYIQEASMTSMYGYGGSCKSYIAGLIAVMVQTGEAKLGYNPIKGNVLILDWEACREDWDERIKAIKVGMEFKSPELPLYRRCYHTLADDIMEIQKIVLERDIKLAVIDSVGMASEITDSFHGSAIQMLRAARSLKCSILLIDHKSKNNEIFGSVYKLNEVRSAFEIVNNQEEESDKIYISIEHTKMNNGRKTKRTGFEIYFIGNEDVTEMVTFKKVDVADIPELAKTLSLKERLINELKHGSMGVPLLAEGLSEKEDVIRMTLNRNKNLFIKLANGTWGLVVNGGLQ